MEPFKRTLCPGCVACSEGEITVEDVTIGEGANTVCLVRAGELPGIMPR